MTSKTELLLFTTIVFFYILRSTNGINFDTNKHCCSLGENYATTGLDCKTFQPPIAGVDKLDEARCLRTVDVCCKRKFREAECSVGQEDAKSGECSDEDGPRKDCCEACIEGISTKKSGEICEDSIGFGEAFIKCCEEADIDNSPNTTTSAPTTTRPTIVPDLNLEPDQRENLETICDTDVCAQLCDVIGNSYRCKCYPHYILMADGVSCKPLKRLPKKGSRCDQSNPCDQKCIDTGTAVRCECYEGWELGTDKQTCQDIDECLLNLHDCKKDEECLNEDGTFSCLEADPFDKCPKGYHFNGSSNTCDDINECEFDIVCERPKTCENTPGSYICKGETRELCPPGYYFKSSINDCADVDECITGDNDCNKESQVCLNTKGNYTCIDKASKNSCPPGFKKNPVTEACEDINECQESDDVCKPGETCVNEHGGHTCVSSKQPGSSRPETVTKPTTKVIPTKFPPRTIKPVEDASCPKGFKHNGISCFDIDECEVDPEACDSNQNCVNIPGSYTCNCKIGYTKDYQTGACVDINECQVGAHDCTELQRCDNTLGSYVCNRITGCGTGYTYNSGSGICEDDDECILGTHNCRSLGPNYKCRNLLGTYRCEAIRPLPSTPYINPLVQRVPPPLTSTTTTTSTTTMRVPYREHHYQIPIIYHRPNPYPINTNLQPLPAPTLIPSFNTKLSQPIRPQSIIPPSIPSFNTKLIQHLPPPTLNRNPSFNTPIISQQKNCLPGYKMNTRGQCEDINECENNPCASGEKCVNYNGRYECSVALICTIGYEINDSGDQCVDVNECSRGTHKCDQTQICKNGQGYYTCECPLGYHLDVGTKKCVDIDECKYYRPCGSQSNCENTPGSFRCSCKEGLKKNQNLGCLDIDECSETPGLCDQKCVNTWGSYRCGCNYGFQLSHDNRTCIDINECEKFKNKKICIHKCKNVPGSYTCECPRGYRLGNDGRVCIDINECLENVCNPQDSCINFGGGYKCFTNECPRGYTRHSDHKSICVRTKDLCDPRTTKCLLQPEQYSYQYISVVSNLPISDGPVQLFKINGPEWPGARADFIMKLVNVDCTHNQRMDEYYFKKELNGTNSLQLYLIKSPQGPQEVKIQIEMTLFNGNAIIGNVVVYIIVIVSEYPF